MFVLFFRVNYDPENWMKIFEFLFNDFKSVHRTNRAQIIDDSLNLAKAGLLDYSVALYTTDYLQQEDDYIPWTSAFTAFKYINQVNIKKM